MGFMEFQIIDADYILLENRPVELLEKKKKLEKDIKIKI